MLRKLLGLVFNRWVLLAVLLLALSLVVWYVGPLVAVAAWHPLDTELSRWIAIGALLGMVALLLAWRAWRARSRNKAVVGQLVAASAAGAAQAESADMAAVRQRFERALLTLRRARFGSGGLLAGWSARLGGRYLYELPWYLIIGAPGSGKTTALRNSGLKFPLADTVGDDVVRGVGGTRHCDWWFTEKAVLIDTAGRFTTQDSDRENDRETWSGFLALLRKARPRQPVNGVLVTVSVADLLTRSGPERAQHAATVRARVQELHEHLGIRFPIYLLVTKSDLIGGFMDYFATLDKEQRAAPWGFTFALDAIEAAPGFDAEFSALERRVTDGLIDRLQVERDTERRARIYGFPAQLAVLQPLLKEFVHAVFAPSLFEARPLLRGVYFASGTQEGTPIDRLLGSIARAYRLERALLPANMASGKGYFLSRLIDEVVFGESGLGSTNRRWERRSAALVLAGYAALAVVAVASLAAWAVSYGNNKRYVAQVDSEVERVQRLVKSTPNRASPDLMPLLPALQATRDLAAVSRTSVPWSLGAGLYQGRKLDSAARVAYERMLVDAVLPRLALRLEEQLRVGDAEDTHYEALKAYLMMHDGDAAHHDARSLKQYIEADWEARFARELSSEQRAAWSEHLDALLAQGPAVSPLALDKPLVEATRVKLAAQSLPQRVYSRMRQEALDERGGEFTIARAGGATAALAFTLASGQPLTKGVPAFFTHDGYHKGFQKQVEEVAKRLADEQGWVLGIDPAAAPVAAPRLFGSELVDAVRRIYLNEYVAVWEAFIADIRMQPLTSVAQSVQMARVLSASDTPLVPLLRAIARETKLSAGGLTPGLIDKADKGLRQKLKQVGGGKLVNTGQALEHIVDDRFAGLHQLVTAPQGGKAPIDEVVGLIGEVHSQLNAVDTAVKGGAAPPPSPVGNKVKSEAQRLPEPVRTLLATLGTASTQVAQTVVRQNLSHDVKSQVGEFCQQAVSGRYPFDRNATRDTTQADFALLFAPGGKIDSLFQTKLAPYVDTSTRPWSFRAVDGAPLGRDVGSLPQFQRAAAIRETFFAAGSAPSLRLDFKPIEMDAAMTQFLLDVDGQVVRYAHGPQIPISVQWPGPRGSTLVRVQAVAGGVSSGFSTEGPWALFRLFDRVRVDGGGAPERFRATFDVDGRKIVFEITASSVRNPFRLRELAEFSCPTGL